MTDITPSADIGLPTTPAAQAHRLSLDHIRRAAGVIPPAFQHSPQYDCEPLSAALGCTLTIKLDFANPIRSFKARGASFLVHELVRRGERRPLVCASAGNWGQALAHVCRTQGLPLVVYAAVDANPLKVARMRALGATVVSQGHDFDAAKAAAKTHADETGGLMLEDGREPEISEGHGTLAIELLAGGAAFDAVVLPLGNGALLAGMARWFKAMAPATQVIGVCAEAAPSMANSWRAQAPRPTATATTIADGIAVREPIAEAVKDLDGQIDDIVLVSDAQIREAMVLACRHAGLLIEPAGAAGLAGVVAHRSRFARQRVATVLCGSNLTPEMARDVVRAI
jgi:threonine dehydratase